MTANVEKSRVIRMAVMSNELVNITTQLFDMKVEKQKLSTILYEASNRDKKVREDGYGSIKGEAKIKMAIWHRSVWMMIRNHNCL